MIRKHICISEQTKILDLACGKGAVSVILAKELGCMARGIDIISEFIDFAREKAIEYSPHDGDTDFRGIDIQRKKIICN